MEGKISLKCIRCEETISPKSKSVKYCSSRCAKLYLKSQYRRKHAKDISIYKKTRRMLGYRSMYKSMKANEYVRDLMEKNGECLKCGTRERLEVHHIKPRTRGGKHLPGNMMILCHKCHYYFEKLTKDFWE